MVDPNKTEEITRIRARLASMDAERAELATALAELERQQAASAPADYRSKPTANTPAVTAMSLAAAKVDLFRHLFIGRPDVFPVHWENRKADRAGHAPACANEWVKGVCGKPQVKCGACPNHAFIPVSDDVIDRHLRGDGQKVIPKANAMMKDDREKAEDIALVRARLAALEIERASLTATLATTSASADR